MTSGLTSDGVAAFFDRERKRMYKIRHPNGCACVVCWCDDFHKRMQARNEARAARCRQVLANPEIALTPAPDIFPVQVSFFAQLDEVSQ